MNIFKKSFYRNIIGDEYLGILDYYRHPDWKVSWGGELSGAFNGQRFRGEIFQELIESFSFCSIFETGTFRGSTTEFMAKATRIPIYTIEGNKRNYGYCKGRFKGIKNINLFLGDSRDFLKFHLANKQFQSDPSFFYLDAHWSEDLPLLEECQIILNSGVKAVIMVDDFKVDHDPGYLFDDYGPLKALTLDYLRPLKDVSFFFPNCKAKEETGAKKVVWF